jgi:AmmeMemoRadiSam system protein A
MSDIFEILDLESGQIVLQVARRGLEEYVRYGQTYQPQLLELTASLREPGASFVTLTNRGELRGCIGRTLAKISLAEDVVRNAAAASRDFRFAPVDPDELLDIRLEVTVLSPFQELAYDNFDDLLDKLRPGIDGVMLTQNVKRALLLPQVWHRLPDKTQFLEAIAHKAGIPISELWTTPPTLLVHIFQAQFFSEPGYLEPGN